MLGPIDLFEID